MFYLTLITFATATWFFYFRRRKQVSLYYDQSQQNIVDKCPSLNNYSPTFYLCGFLHTALSVFTPKIDKNIETEHEKIEGGIGLEWVKTNVKEKKNNDKLIFIMPGLTGSAKDRYINHIIGECLRQGFENIVVYNYRMLQKEADMFFKPKYYNYRLCMTPKDFSSTYTTPEFAGLDPDYHFFEKDVAEGNTIRIDLAADVHHTLEHIKKKYGFKKIYAIGCSYGGIQMADYLGRFQELALLNAGVTVCSPYSMIFCARNLTWSMDKSLTVILQKKLIQNKQILDDGKLPKEWIQRIDIKKALQATHIWDFDKYFTISLYGYKTVDSYYRHFSPINNAKNIQVPLLVISAEDDGVCHKKGISRDEILVNKKAIICMTKRGGHVGFLEGLFASTYWFPKPAVEFLKAQ